MDIAVKDICNYIDFLKKKYGNNISLHGNFVFATKFMKYSFHSNPYCQYIKGICRKMEVCGKKYEKVLQKIRTDGEFFGVCHAGVGEFVYPLIVNDQLTGYVSVSGYKGISEDEAKSKAEHFATKYNFKKEKIFEKRDEFLNNHIPEKNDLDVLIRPLLFMLEAYLEKNQELILDDNDLYTKMLKYINENYKKHITMGSLSQKFSYSVSTLSHIFKKRSGMSINEYIKKMRIEESKWLLKQTNYSVTEISNILGFCNSAYFSSIFKNKCGISPQVYRKNNTK